ncbi:auxin-induced protein 5NG4 [Hibiscus syriacus]|uniref:Auxin-induced protein 5NG4 n=1 Tax=Hibiscus syriacus TaxID=106335 RepID=A0A6A3BFQ8_HIBSY|nr:auxin-induced protein 5NG4 [Hibiscus syriacus]
MAEETHDGPAVEKEAKEATEATAEKDDIELRITTAICSRVGHFKEQSDSLTFEGVRRLLEKDLGLQKCGETVEKNVSTITEGTESPKGQQSKKDTKEPCSEDDKLEESPVLGLLSGQKTKKAENKENKEVSESTIKKAIRNRASYVKANSDKVTMAGLRRLLEEDLKLDKYALDSYKTFIAEQLDEVLKSREASAPASEVKKKNLKKNSQSGTAKRVSKKLSSSSGSENDEEEGDEDDEEEEEEVKPKKNITPKGNIKNFEGLKKRKIPKTEAQVPSKKRSKHTESNSDDNSNEESGSVSDDGRSRSSAAKIKEISAPVYGKRVEHLKSVIKSCGMRESNGVPENKREAQLVKELEEILSKEGLSANPSEKEIKDVRRKKERARELEGIDMSNIVSSSRRRSTTSFVPPPKPKIPDVSDDDESEESDEDDDDEDDGNSQSEESEEEEDGNSD